MLFTVANYRGALSQLDNALKCLLCISQLVQMKLYYVDNELLFSLTYSGIHFESYYFPRVAFE